MFSKEGYDFQFKKLIVKEKMIRPIRGTGREKYTTLKTDKKNNQKN